MKYLPPLGEVTRSRTVTRDAAGRRDVIRGHGVSKKHQASSTNDGLYLGQVLYTTRPFLINVNGK